MKKLQKIINKLYKREQRDIDGDFNYRVHIKLAQSLIEEAYIVGVKEGKKT